MKSNTGAAKELLQKVLKQLPQDFALREVRQHISLALNKLERVERKRIKRAKEEQQVSASNFAIYPAEALDIIEQMIDSETKKLESMKAAKDKKNDDSEHTLLG